MKFAQSPLGRALLQPVHRATLPSVLAVAVALCALAGQLGAWHWALDLLAHFYLHYALLLAVLAGVMVGLGWQRGAALVALAAAVAALPVLHQTATAPGTTEQTTSGFPSSAKNTLRLALANVHTQNTQAAPLLAWIAAEQPDVVVALEVDERWLRDLAPLATVLPFALREPRQDNFGIALFSRVPLRDPEVLDLGGAGLPTLHAKLALPAGEVALTAVHTMPPVDAAAARLRDTHLRALASWCAARPGPQLAVGDFNTTPWSAVFSEVLHTSGLLDSARGQGLQSSWPAALGGLGIPIDQVLLSPTLQVVTRRIGPHIGSDHRPVLLEVRW